MKRQIVILILILLIVTPAIQSVSATKTVFLTSDNIIDQENDLDMLNSIKKYIESLSNGELQVIVDNEAPKPGEGWRAIEVTSDVSICLAAADAGNFVQLAQTSAKSNKQIIFVNTGDFDLDNSSLFLRRAWDDNYSKETLAGLNNPGTFLKNSGIYYIQPVKEFPDKTKDGFLEKSDDEVNKQIAQEVVDIVNTHENDTRVFSDGLITRNVISPAKMAKASQALVKANDTSMSEKYGGYSAPQLLYLTSSYLNGNGIDSPKAFEEPDSPLGISLFERSSYSIYDYFKMAGLVREYMDQNGKAPDSIEYNGAHISYYDLVYNFAKITQNHTNAKHMGFESEYKFEKVNDSLFLHILPFILIFFVLFIAYLIMRKLRLF